MAIPQLDQLPKRITRVREIYERYVSVMPDLPFLTFLPVNLEAGEIPIYNEVLCSDRDRLVQFLDDQGIQARPFAPDLNLATYFSEHWSISQTLKFSVSKDSVCHVAQGSRSQI